MARLPSSHLLPRLHLLARSEKSEDENFLTECLAYVLSTFLEIEPESAEPLLARLCGPLRMSAHGDKSESIAVHTQYSTNNNGVVDLVLKTDDAIAYVEVKVDAVLGEDQLDRYRKALRQERENHKALGTLTRHVCNFKNGLIDFSTTWYEIGEAVRSIRPSTKIGKYARNEFFNLLRHRGLTMKRVSWELKKGIRSMGNLAKMLEGALRDNGFETRPALGGRGEAYFGYYFHMNDKKFFAGMYFDYPGFIYISNEDSISLPAEIEIGEKLDEHRWEFAIDLYTEEAHFFARTLPSQRGFVDEQIRKTTQYISKLIDE